MAWAVATKVQEGVATRLPAGRSMAWSVRVRAWVALTTVAATAPSVKRLARRSSSSDSNGPKLEYQRASSMRRR